MDENFSLNPAGQGAFDSIERVWWPRKPLGKGGPGKSAMGMAKGGKSRGKGGKGKSKKGY
jgi:hypothetical protein